MLPAIIGAIGSIGGALIGNNAAEAERNAANNARQQALAQYLGISVPELKDQELNLQQYQSAGQLNPELQSLINLGPSAMEGISTDPRLQSAQMAALEDIGRFSSGNLTPADLAGFELAKRDSAAADQARQGAILQEMAQRGIAGGGAELAARLKSSQSAADRLAQQEMEQAKALQQARIAALSQQANMAGNIRGQDFSEKSNIAQAQDAISRFNAANAQQVNAANINAKNNAAATNLQAKQQIMNANTGLSNEQQAKNKALLQQKFNNDLTLASGRAGQLQNMASAAQQQAANTAGMWAGIGQNIGKGINATFQKNDEDEE